MTKTVGFSDLETGEASDDTTLDFEEGTCGLLKNSDWTVILVYKPDILFLNESNTDVNNVKRSLSCYQVGHPDIHTF